MGMLEMKPGFIGVLGGWTVEPCHFEAKGGKFLEIAGVGFDVVNHMKFFVKEGDGVVSDEGSNTGGMKGMKGIKAVVPADDIIAGVGDDCVWTEEARRQLGWAKGLGVFKGVE